MNRVQTVHRTRRSVFTLGAAQRKTQTSSGDCESPDNSESSAQTVARQKESGPSSDSESKLPADSATESENQEIPGVSTVNESKALFSDDSNESVHPPNVQLDDHDLFETSSDDDDPDPQTVQRDDAPSDLFASSSDDEPPPDTEPPRDDIQIQQQAQLACYASCDNRAVRHRRTDSGEPMITAAALDASSGSDTSDATTYYYSGNNTSSATADVYLVSRTLFNTPPVPSDQHDSTNIEYDGISNRQASDRDEDGTNKDNDGTSAAIDSVGHSDGGYKDNDGTSAAIDSVGHGEGGYKDSDGTGDRQDASSNPPDRTSGQHNSDNGNQLPSDNDSDDSDYDSDYCYDTSDTDTNSDSGSDDGEDNGTVDEHSPTDNAATKSASATNTSTKCDDSDNADGMDLDDDPPDSSNNNNGRPSDSGHGDSTATERCTNLSPSAPAGPTTEQPSPVEHSTISSNHHRSGSESEDGFEAQNRIISQRHACTFRNRLAPPSPVHSHPRAPPRFGEDPWTHDETTIRVSDLPLSTRLSNDIASYALRNLRATPGEQRNLPYITTRNIQSLLHGLLAAIQHDEYRPPSNPIADSLNWVLNKATILVFDAMSPTQLARYLAQDDFNVIPHIFRQLYDNAGESYNEIGNEIACSMLYALKMVYLTHHRIYSNLPEDEISKLFYARELVNTVSEAFATSTALSFFPYDTSFHTIPWFLQSALQGIDILPRLDDVSDGGPALEEPDIESEFLKVEPYIDAFADSLHTNPYTLGDAFTTAIHLTRQSLTHHSILHQRTDQGSASYPFNKRHTIIGNLPTANSLFSVHTSAFPMLTEPTPEQWNVSPAPHPHAMAVNFVMCKPFTANKLSDYHDKRSKVNDFVAGYAVEKQLYEPLPTHSINTSIDFLPIDEYNLYRVVKLIHESDPRNHMQRYPSPQKVIVFQGTPLYCSNYTYATPTKLSTPREHANIFPIIFNGQGNKIIWNQATDEPYTSTTVQVLFTQKPAVPICNTLRDNPAMIPNTSDDPRFTYANAIHHVATNPTAVPFGLSVRLVQVYTIRPPDKRVFHAWALPHPEDSRSPYQNPYSYFNKRTDHPENRYLDVYARHISSPVDSDSSGESILGNNPMSVDNISGVDLSIFSQNRDPNLNNENDIDNVTPVVKYCEQPSLPFTGKHQAFLAVQTRRSSLRPSTPAPNDDPPTDIENPTTGGETSTTSSPTLSSEDDDITLILPQHPSPESSTNITPQDDTDSTDVELEPTTQPTALQRISLAVSQILTPKPTAPLDPPATEEPAPSTSSTTPAPFIHTLPSTNSTNDDNEPHPTAAAPETSTASDVINTPPPKPKASQSTPRHPTFSYPPRVDTFFTDEDSHNSEEPTAIQQTSPDAMTSSTRTDFTYPPIEDLTKTLLKYASTANLRKLVYPTDLVARRRHFNTYMDNLRIICNISPWTRQVFDLWPEKISYSHPVVGTSLFNLLFTNVTDPCQKHIIDGPSDFRTAIFTLRRHCAPLTSDHIERTRQAFFSLKQQHQEVATSYLNRIRILTRDCYHAGIPNSDIDLIKRTVRGGSNHHFYAASYQRFDADIRRAELNDESLPTFAELESHLLSIDDTRGLTIPSQQQRIYNQHAHSTRHNFPTHGPQRTTHRHFTRRQQQAFSTILTPYTGTSNGNTARNHQTMTRNPSNSQHPRRFPPPNPNGRRNPQTNHQRPSNIPNRNNARPPLRQNNSSNPNQRRPPSHGNNTTSTTTTRAQTNVSNVVCNNCGRTGHYARQCTTPARSTPQNRGQRSPSNNENAPPRNQQRAYYVTDSSNSTNNQNFHHQAFLASMTQLDDYHSTVIWPDNHLPQMEINQPLLDRDFPPSTQHQPPNTNATELYPDDPSSPHQRFGPPHLQNWLPDSGATSHYTPVFSDLRDVEPCNVPISLADGSTKQSTHKGTSECYFTSDDGQKSILGLTDVYYVEGLSHRLLSLTTISGTQNFCVLIKNKATTIQFPDDSTFTWPLLREELPVHQAFAAIASTPTNVNNDDFETESFISDEDESVTTNPDHTQHPLKSLPLELISRRLAHRNFRNLMLGSLHQAWHDHTITPTIDPNNWPLRISVSHKRARNKTPMRQGNEPFHRIHLDLMRNPFRFGLTTNTNFSAYLFIVTTPGKLTGWIGLPTESTASITTALKSWLTQTELLGRTQSVRFIRTDAGTAFTSTKFIATCTELGIKVEAAAPEHQEMNGVCESKWREVHNTANTLLNTARLGGAFFHHAHAYAVQIINACPAKNVTDSNGIPITPFEFCYNRKPSLTNFRVFGCPTFFKRYEPRFNNRLITHKQQLQRASRGIFLGFPDNSAGWLVYSPEQPQSLVITRDAYFDEKFDSALCFDSKPFSGAVPIRSHMDPNGLCSTDENTEPATHHQTGSAANLGNNPSSFHNDHLHPSTAPTPSHTSDDDDHEPPPLITRPETHSDDFDDGPPPLPAEPRHGPIHPNPHQINLAQHQQCHTSLQKQMALYFQECDECPPSIDPIQTAMLTIDHPNKSSPSNDPVDKYLPEPQSLKAVLKLDDDVRSAWLHAIRMEIKNLIDHDTFILGKQPHKNELTIPVKLVLKAKQTATGKLEKLKARLVARGDLEKRRLKKAKAAFQQMTKEQREENANADPYDVPPHIHQIVSPPEPFEDTWSPCASSRGVKLLLSTICAARRTLKSADFIGAYLQAKVIGRHFVKLPLEYAYHFPEYAKYFGIPLLLNKGIYGLVYSGKYWNIEFSEWLYSQGFIQSHAEPSYFVRYDKHNQWLRLLFFVDDMLYAGSNDEIEKQFEDSVKNRFDVKFLGPAQWFLQMRIHQHSDATYTLDQHRYVLNTLQRYDPNSEFPERETPFPTDYIFTKSNRPTNDKDQTILEQKYARLPFRSAVCTLLYLAYNTRADILFAVCKLAKACVCPGDTDYRALTWLIGYIRRRPYYAIKFYPDGTSNPIYDLCRHHQIPYSDLIIFSDASWQDCPDTGRSTVGYMIFRNGALIEANSTMPTPIAMSTSEAEYMAACSATMATAHIRMILYDMMFLGTKQWREALQHLATIPSVLMCDNDATVQIAKNGKLTRKTRHIERRFHFVRQGQQDGTHQLHWIPCEFQLADILTKTQAASKIDHHLIKIFCILPAHLLSTTPGS